MVDGAGELPDLPIVLTEESQRRGVRISAVGRRELDAADWERLGRRYLERTARWRERRPRFTDKLPYNWFYVGAILAMLPRRASSSGAAIRWKRVSRAIANTSPTTSTRGRSPISPPSGATSTARHALAHAISATRVRKCVRGFRRRSGTRKSANCSRSAACRSKRPACVSTKTDATCTRRAPHRCGTVAPRHRTSRRATARCSIRCAAALSLPPFAAR